jgi:hypothetical protein
MKATPIPEAGKPTCSALLRERALHLRRLADIDDELAVREEIAGGEAHYASAPRTAWPPCARSRRHARDMIRRVCGHEQLGKGKATQWRVRVDLYHAAMIRPIAAPEPTSPVLSDEEIADHALAALPLRATKKTFAASRTPPMFESDDRRRAS